MPTPRGWRRRRRWRESVQRYTSCTSASPAVFRVTGRNWYARACRGITYSRWETERFVHLPRMYVCGCDTPRGTGLKHLSRATFSWFCDANELASDTPGIHFALGKGVPLPESSLSAARVSMAGGFSRGKEASTNLHWRLRKMDYPLDKTTRASHSKVYTRISRSVEYMGMKVRDTNNK